MNKLKYGCVGAGGIADSKHLAGYSAIADVEIVAICDANRDAAERLARKYNIPHVYDDYEKMLGIEMLDFISICTPNFLHLPVSLLAAGKGIHIHCEKPIALNAGEAMEIVEAKNKYGIKFMVGLNNRFTNESFFVKKYAEAGLFGEIYHSKCGWRRRREIPGRGGWFTDRKLSGGGPMIDLGVHYLDLVMYFMGNPKPFTVTGATYSKFPDNRSRNSWAYGSPGVGIFDVEDFAAGFLKLENGATVDFEFSWASNIEKEYNYYELLGTKGGASFREGKLKIFSEVLDTNIDIIPNTNYTIKAISEFEHFIDCIKNGRDPIAIPEQAFEIMRIIDAVYQSSYEKKEISI